MMMNPWVMFVVMVLAHLTGAVIVHCAKQWMTVKETDYSD